LAEGEMREWVEEYLEEIQKIEIFFNTKFLEYSHEFDMLKHSFIKKKYGHHKNFKAQNQHDRNLKQRSPQPQTEQVPPL
jgi:hypothetical protein